MKKQKRTKIFFLLFFYTLFVLVNTQHHIYAGEKNHKHVQVARLVTDFYNVSDLIYHSHRFIPNDMLQIFPMVLINGSST